MKGEDNERTCAYLRIPTQRRGRGGGVETDRQPKYNSRSLGSCSNYQLLSSGLRSSMHLFDLNYFGSGQWLIFCCVHLVTIR